MKHVRLLAAKTALAAVLAGSIITIPAQAGIPVIDGGNLVQNVMSAMEAVAQTAPAAYIWDQAQATMNKLLAAQDTLAYYENQLGSLDAYLSKFQDVAYYRGSPCFNGTGGCTPAERAAMEQNRALASESQKKANDALFQGIKEQQKALTADARTLEQLQGKAQGATGQLQAIGYANQLASQQANQLLQIRAMLLAQQNAVAAKMQADADLDAKQQAAHAASTESRIEKTAAPKNWLDLTR